MIKVVPAWRSFLPQVGSLYIALCTGHRPQSVSPIRRVLGARDTFEGSNMTFAAVQPTQTW